jgi:hypothetical protein
VKFICSKADECNDTSCPHRRSHDDCGHTCERMTGAQCVMDVAALPEYGRTGTVAIVIPRRREGIQ